MKNNKGFAPIVVAIAIVAVLAVGTGAYYYGKSSRSNVINTEENLLQDTDQNEISTTQQNSINTNTQQDCNSSTTPFIKVLSPNGGETYASGQTVNIKWHSKCISSNEKISVSIYKKGAQLSQEGSPYGYITTNTGYYNWIIPKDINSSQYEVSVGYILINGNAVYDNSDNYFTIQKSSQTQDPTKAILTIKEDSVPNNSQDFNFLIKGVSSEPGVPNYSQNFILDDDQASSIQDTKVLQLIPGTYSIIQTKVSNWATSWSCTPGFEGGTDSGNGDTITVDIGAGKSVTCIFTNRI